MRISFFHKLGEEVYRTGRERVSGFSIDMYLPPFWGTLVVKNGNVADALVLKAVLLSVERVWGFATVLMML